MKAIQFSGGKDSLACLYLYRDDPEAVVLYADSGSAVPHVREFVHQTVKTLGMRLHVVGPETSCEQWQDETGYPADILPVDASPIMREAGRERFAALVPYAACCYRNLWEPLMRGIAEIGADTAVRGAKGCDPKLSVPDGYVENGITFLSPLWNWSDADVFAYLDRVGATLPPQYAGGADSLDCWCCTAYMDHHGVKRFEYLKAHYPDLYARARERLGTVRNTLSAALAEITLEV